MIDLITQKLRLLNHNVLSVFDLLPNKPSQFTVILKHMQRKQKRLNFKKIKRRRKMKTEQWNKKKEKLT